MTVRGFAVAASTSMTRYTWWPRWLYSNVKAELSLRHTSAVMSYAFGNDASSTVRSFFVSRWKTTGFSASRMSPGFAYCSVECFGWS